MLGGGGYQHFWDKSDPPFLSSHFIACSLPKSPAAEIFSAPSPRSESARLWAFGKGASPILMEEQEKGALLEF